MVARIYTESQCQTCVDVEAGSPPPIIDQKAHKLLHSVLLTGGFQAHLVKQVLGGAIAKRRIQLEHAQSHLAQIQICKNVPTELMFPQIVRKATDTDSMLPS